MPHDHLFKGVALLATVAACTGDDMVLPRANLLEDTPVAGSYASAELEPRGVAEGRRIFRFDDFGSWRFWTGTAQLDVLVEGVSPELALALGLKVDSDVVPPEVLAAADLTNPATTRALLALDAVVGLRAEIDGDRITRVGITCALCHSTVDDAVAPGIGRRLDGWPARDLAIGTILSLLPGLPGIADELGVDPGVLQAKFASWPAGFFDPRLNLDGRFDAPPVLIPAAFGLRGVGLETYTGEGPVSYWNNYVAVTQMRGRGSFHDPRLGVRISVPPREDEVKDKLPSLRQYQYSLEPPEPDPTAFDADAAARGRTVFTGAGECSSCHAGPRFTNGRLHPASVTGTEPTWAERGTTRGYRTTPLRALLANPPYFHDGSAETLAEVVDHYVFVRNLALSPQERSDLIEYLKSL